MHGRWSDPQGDETVRSWARQVFSHVVPHATGYRGPAEIGRFFAERLDGATKGFPALFR